jgi:hypothetical protein
MHLSDAIINNFHEQKQVRKDYDTMPKKGELSKTARASLANRTFIDRFTDHRDPMSGERLLLSNLLPVKVLKNGKTYMTYHAKNTYKMQ